MKKFSLFEAQSRLYGGGNPFSNGHRSKSSGGFLESRHYLLDLDKIIYNDSSVKCIIENKFKPDSKMGNILTDSTHFQKKMLVSLCRKLNSKLFVNITSENKYYEIFDMTSSKNWSTDSVNNAISNYLVYDSDDSIYIEFRNNEPVAIMKRIADNINVDGLLLNMSKLLNCEVYKVDDTGDKIRFYDFRVNLIGETDILQNEIDRPKIEAQWKDVYQKMNLW